jgi:nucleotide-binding universal stress UspA family protein
MFTKILLPTDFSVCSAVAAGVARSLAERFGSRIAVLHVLDEPATLDPMFRGDIPLEMLRSRMENFAQQNMDAFLARCFSGFESFDTIIATHGRTGVEHVIFGSTAEKVVRMSPCPVLSVRQGDKPLAHS